MTWKRIAHPAPLLAFLLLVAGVILASKARGGNVIQDFATVVNDPDNPADDELVSYRVKWDIDEPLRMLLYRDFFGTVVPAAGRGDYFPDDTVQDPNVLVLQAVQRALRAWNGDNYKGPRIGQFEFDEDVLFTDFFQPPLDPMPQFVELADSAFDGVNVITFQDDVITLPAGVIGLTSVFYFNEEFDVGDFTIHAPFPVITDSGAGATVWDTDADDFFDVILEPRVYKQGELVDADIVIPSNVPWNLFPEDIDDLQTQYGVGLEDILDELDIQSNITHEAGHVHGLGHSHVFNAVMWWITGSSAGGLQFFIDPYTGRKPTLDDFVSQAIQYPPSNLPPSVGAFAGQVLDGDYLDTINNAEPPSPYVMQVPVYATVPPPSEAIHPDNTLYATLTTSDAFTEDGQIASFLNDPNVVPRSFRKIASAPTALDVRFNTTVGDFGTIGVIPPAVSSYFFMPGLPIRDDYAIYVEPSALDNVNPVMADVAAFTVGSNPFTPEFYGGSFGPIPGNGFAEINADAGDNKLANRFIEILMDSQSRVSVGVPQGLTANGFGVTSGHPVPYRSYATLLVDGQTKRTRDVMPGAEIQPLVVNDAANLGSAKWNVSDKVDVTFNARLSSAGGTGLEPTPPPQNDALITYTYTNVSGAPVTVGLRQFWNLVALGYENPAYFVDGTQLAATTQFTGAAIPEHIIFQDNVTLPIFRGVVSFDVGAMPAKVVVERSHTIDRASYDVNAGGASIANPFNRGMDTGVAAFYGPDVIEPGQSITYSMIVGALSNSNGFMIDSAWGNLAIEGIEASILFDNPEVAARMATVPGQVVDNITIITDMADALPTLDIPGAGGGPLPPGAIFSMHNDLIPNDNWFSVHGAAGDFDNDGDLDIVVANAVAGAGGAPHNRLLENRLIPDGSLRFIDVTYGADGFPGTPDDRLPIANEGTVGVVMADFNNDGFLDIFFSNWESLGSGAATVNRLYRNRGDGSFEDVTFFESIPGFPTVPGILDTPPALSPDPSTRPTAGDIDGDGDIDLIIPYWGAGLEFASVGTYQDTQDTIDGAQGTHFDGLFNPADGSSDTVQSEVAVNARILINQQMETGAMFFLDDTLGRDHALGGFMPLGGAVDIDNLDRMPPMLPDFAQTNDTEQEISVSAVALLAPAVGDNSLDLLIAEGLFFADTVTNQTQPYGRVYNNFDIHDDLRPDGYFAHVTFGCDFPLFAYDGVQLDLMPFLTSLPLSFPEGGNTATPPPGNPDNTVNSLPFVAQVNVNSVVVGDFAYMGTPTPAFAVSEADSYYFQTRREASNAANNIGADRGTFGFLGGSGLDFVNQFAGLDLTLSNLSDRNPFPGAGPSLPAGPVPTGGLTDGSTWDYVEETPTGGDFMIPASIGLWDPSLTLTTGPAGTHRTRDLTAADFDLDGDLDIFFANDLDAEDSTAGGTDFAINQIFLNEGFGTFVEATALALSLEPPAPSVAVVQGDFDNDGDVDLYILNAGRPNHLLINRTIDGPPILTDPTDAPLYLDANVQFLPPIYDAEAAPPAPSFSGTANMSFASAVADVNGDGRPDFVVANGGPFTISGDFNLLYMNTGEPLNQGVKVFQPSTGVFPLPATFQQEFDFQELPTMDVMFADLDLDGDYDMVDVNLGVGPRFFSNEDSDAPGLLAGLNPLSDIDDVGDGIFINQFGWRPFPLDNPDCLQSGFDLFLKLQNTALKNADFDGDGLPDIVIANALQPDGGGGGAPNLLFLNRLSTLGTFIEVTEENLPTRTDSIPAGAGGFFDCTQGILDDTYDVAVGDFNEDGFVDIFFANDPSAADGLPNCRLLLNDGTGAFVDASHLLPPLPDGRPGVVAVGDFDGNGEATEDVNYNGVLDPGFDVDGDGLLENGEDSFFSRHSARAGSILPGWHDNGILDFDDANLNGVADLSLDLFIGYADRPDVLLLWDRDLGRFVDASANLPAPSASIITQGADVGDIDLDGDLDIVLVTDVNDINDPTSRFRSNVTILLNDGNGVFTDVSYEAPFPASMGVAEDTSNVLHGDGRDIKLFDFDGDGDLDIHVCQAGSVKSGLIQGYLNFTLLNRIRGDNFNAERFTLAQVPGRPVIKVVSPPGAFLGAALTAQITGYNFSDDSVIEFGEGVQVVGEPILVSPRKILVNIVVDAETTPGPRQVTVHSAAAEDAVSPLGAFIVMSPTTPGEEGNAVGDWSLYETPTTRNLKGEALQAIQDIKDNATGVRRATFE